ncbi:hypothetical protein Cni_G26149 [Canna indica]|uniref:Uncharacterized protein n=1 Tax=Canna indica TaxID=4628 RepID=A0AAQ3L5J8_9LILI|nr:hypothetical protein Cni_G26149 [Canna indica]
MMDNLIIENFQSPLEAFESTSSRNSSVTLAEVPSNSGVQFVPANDINIPKFLELLGIPEDDVVDILVENLILPEADNLYANLNVAAPEEAVPIETDDFPRDININFDDNEEKLPDIFYAFWEQFFMASPMAIDTEEAESITLETKENQRSTDDG